MENFDICNRHDMCWKSVDAWHVQDTVSFVS